MNKLNSKIESLLFAATKDLRISEIAGLVAISKDEAKNGVLSLSKELEEQNCGIVVVENNGKYRLATHPENSKIVQQMISVEMTGDLTPASLEALTVIAYRGPVSQIELEQIRGVSCTVILRNLLIKGLIEKCGKNNIGEEDYQISFEFLKYLGVSSVRELPGYDNLHQDKNLLEFLERGDI